MINRRPQFEDRFSLLQTSYGTEKRSVPYEINIQAKPIIDKMEPVQFKFYPPQSIIYLSHGFKASQRPKELEYYVDVVASDVLAMNEEGDLTDLLPHGIDRPQKRPGDIYWFEEVGKIDLNNYAAYRTFDFSLNFPCNRQVTAGHLPFDQNLAVYFARFCDLDTIGKLRQLNKWWNKNCKHESIWKGLWKYRSNMIKFAFHNFTFIKPMNYQFPRIEFDMNLLELADDPGSGKYEDIVKKCELFMQNKPGEKIIAETRYAINKSMSTSLPVPFDIAPNYERSNFGSALPKLISRDRAQNVAAVVVVNKPRKSVKPLIFLMAILALILYLFSK